MSEYCLKLASARHGILSPCCFVVVEIGINPRRLHFDASPIAYSPSCHGKVLFKSGAAIRQT